MTLHKVRATNRPDIELEVGDEELADLKYLGLLVESDATTEEGLRRAAERQISQKKEG